MPGAKVALPLDAVAGSSLDLALPDTALPDTPVHADMYDPVERTAATEGQPSLHALTRALLSAAKDAPELAGR